MINVNDCAWRELVTFGWAQGVTFLAFLNYQLK